MNKLLSSISLSALALCLSLSFAQAMDVEATLPSGVKRKISSHSLKENSQEVDFPEELWRKIIFHTLEMNPRCLPRILVVSRNWRDWAPGCVSSLDPWRYSIKNENIVKKFPNLTTLNLCRNDIIKNDVLRNLTNLTTLDLEENDIIQNDVLQNLTNLTKLNLGESNTITDEGLQNLTNLTKLSLYCNSRISDEGLQNLTNLTKLILCDNSSITDEGLKNLTNLTKLILCDNIIITWMGIKNLRNLENYQELRTEYGRKFIDEKRMEGNIFFAQGQQAIPLMTKVEFYFQATNCYETILNEFPDLAMTREGDLYRWSLSWLMDAREKLQQQVQAYDCASQQMKFLLQKTNK